jgi:hypothetical protein
VCGLVEHGILALFGPSDPLLGSHIQSICDALDIPHLEARNDIEEIYQEFSLNLQPSQDLMNRAYKVKKEYCCWRRRKSLKADPKRASYRRKSFSAFLSLTRRKPFSFFLPGTRRSQHLV